MAAGGHARPKPPDSDSDSPDYPAPKAPFRLGLAAPFGVRASHELTRQRRRLLARLDRDRQRKPAGKTPSHIVVFSAPASRPAAPSP
jgi:hypothetical protein